MSVSRNSGRYDGPPVVILGNGPVGQTTALLLARWGIPSLVLDQRPERDLIGSKALCQQRDVLDIWDSVGVGRAVVAEGRTWTRSRTYHRDTELFTVAFADRGESPFPPFVNLSQSRTEELLDDAIADEPLIATRWGAEVVELEQDDQGVRLGLADGGVVTAPYVVAAAGVRADRLRTELGLTFDGHSFTDLFLICDIRADLPGWESERRFWFDPAWNPGRQVLIHPCPDSGFRIDWQVPADYDVDAEVADGGLERRIRAIVGQADYEVIWRSVYRFHSRAVERMRVGRVLLAGDMAHVVAPFGARGLNSGVQDAENAAWKLAFVLHGWAPDRLLDSYSDERLAAARENLEVTGATMRFLVPQDEAERRSRLSILEAAAHDAGARARVDSGRLAEPFWYADSPLTTPDQDRPEPVRPPRGETPTPAPGVLVPDVALADGTRVRALARQGFTVLCADAIRTDRAGTHQLRAIPDVTVVTLATADPAGRVAGALGMRPGEAWVLRPDAHIAAVVPATFEAVNAAVRRATGVAPVSVPSPEEVPDGLLPARG